MRTWKRTYLLPGILLERTRTETASGGANHAWGIPKGAIVLYLGIVQNKTKLISKFLYGEKIYEWVPFSGKYATCCVEQVEAWIKSNFKPVTTK